MNTPKPNQVRIIAGQWRGRKIRFPDTVELRPSSDRIRETAFNWLQMRLTSSKCLDLFAGSGVCGFESLSRGADSVIMVDHDPLVVKSLEMTKEKLGATAADILSKSIPSDTLREILHEHKFDIVFIDPPFQKGMVAKTCEWLADIGCLSEDAVVYIETEASLEPLPIPDDWEILKAKKAGNVRYYLITTGEVN